MDRGLIQISQMGSRLHDNYSSSQLCNHRTLKMSLDEGFVFPLPTFPLKERVFPCADVV